MSTNRSQLPRLVSSLGIPVVACLVGLFWAYYPMVLSGFRRVETDLRDTPFNNYVLEHGYQWLRGAALHRDFWSPPIFYPHPNTAAYSDILLTVGPFYWIWRFLGAAPDTSFQLWLFTVAILNFAGAYLLLRRWFDLSAVAGSLGAFLFAFGSPRLAQIGHQQLVPQFYTLLAFYALFEIFQVAPEKQNRTRVTTWIAIFFLSATAQLYAGFYQGWFLVFCVGVAALWAVILRGYRQRLFSTLREYLIPTLLSMTVSAWLLLPMLNHYMAAAGEVRSRLFIDAYNTMPRWQTWLYMGETSWLYGWTASAPFFTRLEFPHEQVVGIGLVTLVLVVWGLVEHRQQSSVRLLGLTAGSLILYMLVLSSAMILTAYHFYYVPGAYAVRIMSRIGLIMLFPASVGLALFFQKRLQGRVGWLLPVLALLVVLEQGRGIPSYDKIEARAEIQRLADQVPADCEAFFLTPREGSTGEYNILAMWVQLRTGKPTVNGYSGNQPPNWPFVDWKVETEHDREMISLALRKWATLHRMDPEKICWIQIP